MKPRAPAVLSVLAAFFAALGPRLAWTAERACPTIAVQADANFRARFPDLLERIESELLARADIDACARVALRVEGGAAFGVSVTLPDGRTAARSAARAEDVVPTLQALLLVPAPAPVPVTVQPPPPSAPLAKRPARHVVIAPAEAAKGDLSTSPATAARQLGFELSVVSGVRFGDTQVGYGVGVLSFLEVHRWLIGFQGRADGYRSLFGGDPETALELAILSGRRFYLGDTALDLTAGPAVAMKGVAFAQTERVEVNGVPTMMPPPPRSEPNSGPVPRLLLGARLGFSPRSLFRTFVGLDGELGPTPTAIDSGFGASSSRMPSYTVGLALGATVGAP